jgi:sugar lactone lactonase YvrE
MRASFVWLSVLVCLALLLGGVVPAAAQSEFPAVLPLPDGFNPEGIATGFGTTFYVGSLANGAIYRGDLRTGEGDIFIPGETGRVAVGLDFDRSTGYLYVAGGATGMARVYDTEDGSLVEEYALSGAPVFINDVVVTRTAAYFTDSQNARLFIVPLEADGSPAGPEAVKVLPLTGDWEQVPNAFNANGIVATKNGKALIVVNSTVGALYRVDPRTGYAQRLDLGGASVTTGDGLLLHGKFIYVVRNRMNLIDVFRLSPDFLSAELVKTITDPTFDVPTTIAEFGRWLYAVNARFTTPPGPTVEYWVTRVAR